MSDWHLHDFDKLGHGQSRRGVRLLRVRQRGFEDSFLVATLWHLIVRGYNKEGGQYVCQNINWGLLIVGGTKAFQNYCNLQISYTYTMFIAND